MSVCGTDHELVTSVVDEMPSGEQVVECLVCQATYVAEHDGTYIPVTSTIAVNTALGVETSDG